MKKRLEDMEDVERIYWLWKKQLKVVFLVVMPLVGLVVGLIVLMVILLPS